MHLSFPLPMSSCLRVALFILAALPLLAWTGLIPLRLVSMYYPRLALLAGTQGEVDLKCVLAGDGSVMEASIVSGPKILAFAAKANALRQQFATPSRKIELVYVFRLEG